MHTSSTRRRKRNSSRSNRKKEMSLRITSRRYQTLRRQVSTRQCTGPVTTDTTRWFGSWWKNRWVPWSKTCTATIASTRLPPMDSPRCWNALCNSEWICSLKMRALTPPWTWLPRKRPDSSSWRVRRRSSALVPSAMVRNLISVTSSTTVRTVATSSASCAPRKTGFSRTKTVLWLNVPCADATSAWMTFRRVSKSSAQLWMHMNFTLLTKF